MRPPPPSHAFQKGAVWRGKKHRESEDGLGVDSSGEALAVAASRNLTAPEVLPFARFSLIRRSSAKFVGFQG